MTDQASPHLCPHCRVVEHNHHGHPGDLLLMTATENGVLHFFHITEADIVDYEKARCTPDVDQLAKDLLAGRPIREALGLK